MRMNMKSLRFDDKRRMHITKLKKFDKVKVVGHTLVQQLAFNFTTHYQHICITQNGTRIIKKTRLHLVFTTVHVCYIKSTVISKVMVNICSVST